MKNLEFTIVENAVRNMQLEANTVYAVKLTNGGIAINNKGCLNLVNLYGDKKNGISNRFGRCSRYNTIKSVVHWICLSHYHNERNFHKVVYNINEDINEYTIAMGVVCVISTNEFGRLDHILRFKKPIGKLGFDLANTDKPEWFAVYSAFSNWKEKRGNKNFYSAKVNRLAVDTIKCLEVNSEIIAEYKEFDGEENDKERAKEDAETIAKQVERLQKERDAIVAQLEAQSAKPKATQRKTTKRATQTA